MGLPCTSWVSSHRRRPEPATATATAATAVTIATTIPIPTVAAANTATIASPAPTWRDFVWIWMSVPCQVGLNHHLCDVLHAIRPQAARQPPPFLLQVFSSPPPPNPIYTTLHSLVTLSLASYHTCLCMIYVTTSQYHPSYSQWRSTSRAKYRPH